ncbi:hypothetical protein DRQ33_04380 [bacterium]|nr:MAG: hypothetical protein DRQ33_04380 [bacterium]
MTTVSADPAISKYINYQGKITDSTGVAVNDTVSIIFRIYDTPTLGSPLWTETHPEVGVTRGLFDVILGKITPLDIPFDTSYFMELIVDGEVLSPRVELNAVPYAFRALYADSVNLDTLSNYVRLDDLPDLFIWNQDTILQAGNFRISGVARAGTLEVAEIRGQGYAAFEYSSDPKYMNDTLFTTLFSAPYEAYGFGSAIMVSFTGTFDDRANKRGAAMEIQLVRSSDGTVLTSQREVLANRELYTDRVVSLTALDFPPAGVHIYAVRARMIHTPLNAGRFLAGNLKLVEIKD